MTSRPPEPALAQDALLGGRVRFCQPPKGYRVAIDPVLLAAAVPAAPDDHVLELGCGSGAAALCLLARVPRARVTGLELQAEFADLAARNAALNLRSDFFKICQGDVLAPPPDLDPGSFDQVMLNPPYVGAGRGRASATRTKALATQEGAAELDAWLSAALKFLRPKGRLAMIHRADRLDEVLANLRGGAGDFRVFPLWPSGGRAAKRVLIGARKGVATPMTLCPGLVLHDADGRFTTAAEAILRGGAEIPLFPSGD